MTPETPANVGRYRILSRLGGGAMGEVYLAEDPNIQRLLAIKTVRLLGSDDEIAERSQRLLREAKAAGRLLHPHAVTLFDAGEADGTLYLAFELVDGPDLGQRMRQEPPLAMGEALRLVRQVAEALEYAHAQGVVHRDVKPANILIGAGGDAKVADFGIAKLTAQSTELTRTGSVIGSPQYMSPEQIRGEALDGRSDLFSLGAILYELLSGVRAFAAETLGTLVFQIISTDPPSLRAQEPAAPAALIGLVERMMAKDPAQRPASAGAVAEELAAFERDLPAAVLAAPACPAAVAPTRSMPSVQTAPPAQAAPPAVPEPPAAVPPPPPVTEPPAAATVSPPPPAGGETVEGAGAWRAVSLPMIVAAAIALVALGAGAVWLRGVLAPPARPAGLGVAATVDNPVDGGGEGESRVDARDGDPGLKPRATDRDPGLETRDRRAAAEGSETGEGEGDDEAEMEPLRDEMQDALAEVPTPRVEETAPPPPATLPVTPPPPTTTAAPTPPPPPMTTTAPSARFDAFAGFARQHLETGLLLRFDVRPPETRIRYLKRGDARPSPGGRVRDHTVDRPLARPLRLPEEGEYLIVLQPPGGGPEHVVLVQAKLAHRQIETIRADLGSPGRSARGPRRLEVARAVAFRGEPERAAVHVDGRLVGPASRWPGAPGADHPHNLRLDPGTHQIRLSAPGHRDFELTVVVRAGAPSTRTVDYRLVPE